MLKKWTAATVATILSVSTLAACTKSSGDDKEERVLRIATSFGYGDDSEYLRRDFTEIFEFANPNIKIEFIPTNDDRFMYKAPGPNEKMQDPMEKLKEVMQGENPPDIVITGFEQLPELIESNMLAPLDPHITKDKFDTSGIVPLVLDGIKGLSTDGKLYAMTPTFSSPALIYNKKMFADAGVELPKDNMTWDQMFDLAQRLTRGEGADRKYGFSFSSQSYGDIFNSMNIYTNPLQLRMFDDTGDKMAVDNDQWEQAWKRLIDLQKQNIMPGAPDQRNQNLREDPNDYNPFAYDDFLSGRVAMTIIQYYDLTRINNANKNATNIKGFTPIDWDIVTVPSHAEAPGVVANIGMNGVMGINTKAGNVNDAWKLIKFINGVDWAKLRANSSSQMVSRKDYIKPKAGQEYHVEAFYNVKPSPVQNEFNKFYRQKPNIWMVQDLARNEFQAAVQGTKSVREALKSWQTNGDLMLQQIKDNPNGPVDMGMFRGNAVAVPAG
ncbi:ABC transporter substrate-binding protein [Paenibacillus sp. MBLB4367]|uniref:ABC transporter substrate-binding protein n=1 Tax=Paenibacillus sp. MBLB4367 TaxID=3384767 RepID=UPI003907F39E